MDLLNFELWLTDRIHGRRIDCQARERLVRIARNGEDATRQRTMNLLNDFAREPGPHVALGSTTAPHAHVRAPLRYLIEAHATATGGTGAGKTMSICGLLDQALDVMIEAIRNGRRPEFSFGTLDGKGELFRRLLCLIALKLRRLDPREAKLISDRILIIDLSSPDPVTSYNIASPWSGCDLDFFATSRVSTLEEILDGDGFSLRGGAMVKHALKLLAEQHLSFRYIEQVLSSDAFRAKLIASSADEDVRSYFRYQYENEPRATKSAVLARLSSSLLGSGSLKLALSGKDAPDFRKIQDDGTICLINCAGPSIPRATTYTLQALFLSDIRQGIFTRKNSRPYLWVCDESQTLFRTRNLKANMTDILTMSRSYGSFFWYLTQNLASAVQDSQMLETLYTNIRWSLTLRGTTQDAAFLKPAFPITGRRQKTRLHPYAPIEYYKVQEERDLLLQEITHLPDFTGWIWFKSLTGEAIQIRTRIPDLPRGEAFNAVVNQILQNPTIGHRLSRDAFLAELKRRDAEWHKDETENQVDQLTDDYAKTQKVRKPRER